MLFNLVPCVSADNMDGDYSIINNYEQLLKWRNAGCPSDGTNMIVVLGDFGWPTEEVVIDFGVKTAGSGVMLYNSNTWTIPENVTLKNLNISLADKATLNLDGKLHNNRSYAEGDPIEILRGNKSTINLGKNAEVKGSVHLCAESVLNSSGAYAEEVIASVNGGTSSANLATVSGTLKADELSFHNNMSLSITAGSTVEVAMISGNSNNTVNIENGATLYFNETYMNLMANVHIKNGGKMAILFAPLTTYATLTIDEGGVCSTYNGVDQRAQHANAKIKGAGTIELYGMSTFGYNNSYYETNPNVAAPGTVPMLDATVVIKQIEDCDHADGKAYRYVSFTPAGQSESTQHIQMCSACRETVRGTEAPHSYTLEGAYDTFSRYRCVCGRSYTVERSTGSCGEDLAFVIEESILRFDGVGAVTEFVPTSGTWAEQAAKVEKVVLGSGITSVGENAFAGCDNLAQVEYSGSYEDWKALDIKAGNDALKYAEVSLGDGSVLLSAAEEYRAKADLVYKEETAEGKFTLSLIEQGENAMTEDEIKKLNVISAAFAANELLSAVDTVVPTITEGTDGAKWTGDLPTGAHKLFVWDENMAPVTRVS